MSKKAMLSGNDLLRAFREHLSSPDMIEIALSLKISNAITEARKELGWTQGDLAQRVGVSQPVVSKWESGDSNFTLSSIILLFDALDIDFELLIGEDATRYRGDSIKGSCWDIAKRSTVSKWTFQVAEGA